MGNCCTTTSSAYEGVLRPLAKSVLFKDKSQNPKLTKLVQQWVQSKGVFGTFLCIGDKGHQGLNNQFLCWLDFPLFALNLLLKWVQFIFVFVFFPLACRFCIGYLKMIVVVMNNAMQTKWETGQSSLAAAYLFLVKLNHVKWQLVCYQTVQVNWGTWLDNWWKLQLQRQYLLCSGVRIQSNDTEKLQAMKLQYKALKQQLISGTTHPHNTALSTKRYSWSILKYL